LSGLTFLVETVMTAWVISYKSRPWLYSYFGPVESGFIVYIFYRAAMVPLIKRMNTILLIILPIGIGISFYLTPDSVRLMQAIVLFCLFINLIAACLFLADVLLHKADIPLARHPFFWMASGILIFCWIYGVLTPLLSHFTKLRSVYFLLDMLVANLFMYSGFIACFICFRRTNSASSTAKVSGPAIG